MSPIGIANRNRNGKDSSKVSERGSSLGFNRKRIGAHKKAAIESQVTASATATATAAQKALTAAEDDGKLAPFETKAEFGGVEEISAVKIKADLNEGPCSQIE